MNSTNSQVQMSQQPALSWGHFGTIMLAAVLLLGMAYMEKPQLFSFHSQASSDVAMLHYVPYVPSADDLPQPAVLGASTDQGPDIIGDDGSVEPVDMGEVLGASTQGVQLSLTDIKVNTVADSDTAIKNYFNGAQAIEANTVNSTDFAGALNSGDQTQINQQAQKIQAVLNNLEKLFVPQSLVQLQKLKIIQYNSSIALLQNFTQDNTNPDQVNSDLQEFLKSQQDLDDENIAVAQKFPQDDPQASLYINPDGTPAISQSTIDNFGSDTSLPNQDTSLTNSDNINAGQ